MKNRLLIQNARVIDPGTATDAVRDIFIADGRFTVVGAAPAGFEPDQIIDATGLLAVPGLVDLRSYLREPGFEHKATIQSEATAAAANGFTTLVCTAVTIPVIDDVAVVQHIQSQAKHARGAQVLPLGALTVGLHGETLADLRTLIDVGCVGVSNFYSPIENTLTERRALEYAASHDVTVHFFPEDPWLARNACSHEGVTSTRLGLRASPAIAETIALARILTLAEHAGAKLHIGNVSTAGSVDAIAAAQQRGVSVTADVAIHQLFFTDEDLASFNTNLHVRPPFRSEQDRLALIDGLKRGIITAICSDHQPHDNDAKLMPFGETEAGISSFDTFIPLLLELASEHDIALVDAFRWVTSNPAIIINHPELATIAPNQPANLCLLAPNDAWSSTRENIVSRGKNTPWLNASMLGRSHLTLINGETVFTRH